MTHVIEGEDAVNVPAAPMEYLGHARVQASHAHMPKLLAKSMEGRRTAIPVLLVSGLMFAVAGALKYVVGEDSPISDFPAWMSISLFAVAAVLIAVAVLNMLQVRQQLGAIAAAKAAAATDTGEAAEAAE